jgi:adenosylmethionine-8-amino-7-oxononanoate aminotransferase
MSMSVQHDYKQKDLDHLWLPFTQMSDFKDKDLLVIERGEGCYVFDDKGNRYFDLMSGMWLNAVGYGRKEIANAVFDAMQLVTYNPWGSTSRNTMELSTRVASLSPDKEARVFLANSGSEANETAMKMAKRYHANRGEPSRFKMISRRGSYHGATHANMALGGGGVSTPWEYGPLQIGNVYVPQPLRYRCPYCSSHDQCNLECAAEVERAILYEGPNTIAAFVGEPISLSAGVAPPHPEYWPTIRKVCDKYGILLIMDEVVTGFGRTGKWFASEHWGVKPDITTVAKQLSSGYLPLAATIASKHVADAFLGGEREKFKHLLTFGGHPVCCAAALANLKIIEDEKLVENSAKMGDYLFASLQRLRRHVIVGDIRGGYGLFCGIELVSDRAVNSRFPKEIKIGERINAIMMRNGLMTRPSDVIPLLPPLIITKDQVDAVVDTLDACLGELQEDLGIGGAQGEPIRQAPKASMRG